LAAGAVGALGELDEPLSVVTAHYGGDVAAPVFSQVVQQTLRMMNVQPDLDVKPQIVAREIPAEVESF
jgi:cell division protein FtsI (penicillin-binding protein 3)